MPPNETKYVVVFDLGRGKHRESQPLSYNQALTVMSGAKNPTDVKVYQPTSEVDNVIQAQQAAQADDSLSEREKLAIRMGWKFNY